MHIELYLDQGDEPWALLAKGHLSLDTFKRHAAKEVRRFDIADDVASAMLGHFHMRHAHPVDMEKTDDWDEDHAWHWCEAAAEGAVPVTAYKF